MFTVLSLEGQIRLIFASGSSSRSVASRTGREVHWKLHHRSYDHISSSTSYCCSNLQLFLVANMLEYSFVAVLKLHAPFLKLC